MANLIPKSKYTNYYDIARFNLTWYLNLIILAFLPALVFVLFKLDEISAYPSLVATLVCIIVFFILLRTRSYTVPAILYSVLGTLLCISSFIYFPKSLHFVDTLWMMMIVLYTYFTLGKVWGTVLLAVSISFITYYILFNLEDKLKSMGVPFHDDVLALAINFMLSGIVIAFMMFQFLKLNQFAENKYITLNNELKDKNREKSILLKEIHHRVKNNLQVVTSLLRLQSKDIDDKKYRSMYKDSINRVMAMSMIHEKIYQTNDLANINLENYIKSLVHDLIRSYSIDTEITLNINSNIKTLSPRSLVPVALIFNELISNSFKHGFVNRDSGTITIEINNKYPKVKMTYSDDGQWIESAKESSLGLELINSLTEQLTGSFVRSTENGTHYTFHFAHDD